MVKPALIIAGIAAFAAAGATLFVESGFYNIGADEHHWKITLGVIGQLRDRSIAARARSINPLLVADPKGIKDGAQHYAALCVGCHLAPGVNKSDIRTGLYPHPPNLPQEEVQDPQRAFWIIKHGIKMTGMPAWGKTLDDAAIWDVVAFVRKMPDMAPETYQQLLAKP
jgi:mono/diheme cytochrome c family protein